MIYYILYAALDESTSDLFACVIEKRVFSRTPLDIELKKKHKHHMFKIDFTSFYSTYATFVNISVYNVLNTHYFFTTKRTSV